MLHEETIRLLKKFLNKFVKTSVISAHKCPTTVPFDLECNQWNDDRLAVGMPARRFIDSMSDESTDDPSKLRFFR